MKRYELHTHTNASRCSSMKPETIIRILRKKGFDGVAVTDHNTIKGALKVKRLNKHKDFEVIIAEEVLTEKGDILAYYIQEEIPRGRMDEVLDNIKDQDGIAVLAHPLDFLRHHFKDSDLRDRRVRGIEVFNSRTLLPWINLQTRNITEALGMPMTGGSDAHFWFELGRTYTGFDDNENLRSALKRKRTVVRGTSFYGPAGMVVTGAHKLKGWIRTDSL